MSWLKAIACWAAVLVFLLAFFLVAGLACGVFVRGCNAALTLGGAR